jgi:hypothetical protein
MRISAEELQKMGQRQVFAENRNRPLPLPAKGETEVSVPFKRVKTQKEIEEDDKLVEQAYNAAADEKDPQARTKKFDEAWNLSSRIKDEKTIGLKDDAGKVKFGEATLNRIRENQENERQAQAQRRASFNESIKDRYAAAKEKREAAYDESLAARGLRNPRKETDPNERKRIQDENNREIMNDFRVWRESQVQAKAEAQQIQRDASLLKKAKQDAVRSGQYEKAAQWDARLKDLRQTIGGDPSSVDAVRKFTSNAENENLKRQLEARSRLRREINEKRTSANPEARTFGKDEQGASWNLETQPSAFASLPTPPPSFFDADTPQGAGATSPQVTATRPTSPVFPTSQDNKKIEASLPGVTSLGIENRRAGESMRDYTDRVKGEYDEKVIIPSFDEGVRSALISARELNSRLNQFEGARYVAENVPRIKKIKEELKPQQDILKKEISKLKSAGRTLKGEEKKINNLKIESLQKELTFFGRLAT